MMTVRFVALVLIGGMALGAEPAAADQLLAGKRLSIRKQSDGVNRLAHLARDTSLIVGNAGTTGDPRCSAPGGGGTSSLRIAASGVAGDVTIPLPCAGWSTNAANTLYRYRDPSGATCRLVLVKHHALVKAACVGPQIAIDHDATMAPVALATTLNAERYCTEFGGTITRSGADGRTFVARDAAAPAACPATSTTTSTSSTSSTTLSYCCALPGRCTFSNPNQNEFFCESAGGTLHAGFECNGGDGSCVAGSGVAGPCCESNCTVPHFVSCEAGPSVSGASCVSSGSCIASFYPSAVCTTGGTCQP